MHTVTRMTLLAALLGLTGLAAGQGAPMDWLRVDTLGRRGAELEIDSEYACSQGTDPSGGMGWWQGEVGLSMPLLQREDRHDLSLALQVEQMTLDSSVRLPQVGAPFPDHLWDVGTGLVGRTDTEWGLMGLSAIVHSPSDRPFEQAEDVELAALAFWRIEQSDELAWLVMLGYDGPIRFDNDPPLPGAALMYTPGRQLQLGAGVPLSWVVWRPIETVTLSGFYLLPRTIATRAAWQCAGPVTLFAGFSWDNRAYYRHDRADDEDALTLYEKRLAAGVEWALSEHISLEAQVGFAFDRFWFEGEDYDDRGDDRIDLGDGPFTALTLRVSF